jgi:hypothetical protein
LPDGGFLRQIWTILADLKVVWRAKNISGGLLISGGFLADLTNFAWFCFCLADSGGLVSISKTTTFFSLSLAKKNYLKKSNFVQNIFKKDKYFSFATSRIRQNPH